MLNGLIAKSNGQTTTTTTIGDYVYEIKHGADGNFSTTHPRFELYLLPKPAPNAVHVQHAESLLFKAMVTSHGEIAIRCRRDSPTGEYILYGDEIFKDHYYTDGYALGS